MQLLTTEEHKIFGEKEQGLIQTLELNLCETNDSETAAFLNLSKNFQVGYFIGLDWLQSKELAIMVNPKIADLDYLKMFMECFSCPEIASHLSEIYKIKFNEPPIELKTTNFELTPLLVFHFLNTAKNIVKKGLKKDYVRKEDNLQSKIKGKIVFGKSLKMNNFKGRIDRNYCNFQEYSLDCIENKVLKKALIFVKSYLQKHYRNETNMMNTLNYCLSAFSEVNEIIESNKIKQFKINPLYKEYAEGLVLAKMVLQQFSYNITETSKEKKDKVPPFYINMALLFELYVYGKLKKQYGSAIIYQAKGKYGNADFLDIERKIIIDTKYKMLYEEEKYEIENIRQLSAYARDKGILNKLKLDETEKGKIVDCLIIFPSQSSLSDSLNLTEKNGINQFEQFYKIGIKLPTKS